MIHVYEMKRKVNFKFYYRRKAEFLGWIIIHIAFNKETSNFILIMNRYNFTESKVILMDIEMN